jgi:hypothetical protein
MALHHPLHWHKMAEPHDIRQDNRHLP